ncbi:hypothetical protein BH10BDE1_BH10BDE1_01230 [soil metagenome]
MSNFENEKTPATKPEIKKDPSISHKVGDAVERVGEKLKDVGAEKLGNSVYQAGNKLEHKDERKNK